MNLILFLMYFSIEVFLFPLILKIHFHLRFLFLFAILCETIIDNLIISVDPYPLILIHLYNTLCLHYFYHSLNTLDYYINYLMMKLLLLFTILITLNKCQYDI